MIVTHKHIDQHLKTITEPRLSQIKQLIDMMSKVTQRTPEMWGSIIGFGSVHYTYASGLSGDMPILGLANRKQAITLYLSNDISKFETLSKLGIFTTGKSCLYIKKLSDINLDILMELMIEAYNDVLKYAHIQINY